MLDYSYYRDVYLGEKLSEKEFGVFLQQAEAHLERFKRIYQVRPAGGEAEAMALCAMAEKLQTLQHRQPGVTGATVGGVSVRYEPGSGNRGLLDAAAVYLDIYRGRQSRQ